MASIDMTFDRIPGADAQAPLDQGELSSLPVGKCPSELSRFLLKARFAMRRLLGPVWIAARRLLRPPLIGGLIDHVRARAEVLQALRGGTVDAGAPASPDALDPAMIPSLTTGARGDEPVLAEIDQDGFLFAVDQRDAAFFPSRQTKLPRVRYRLDVVLRDGRVCVRKQFCRLPLGAGLRAWFAGLVGEQFFNETAALLRLRGLPFVPSVRAVDVRSQAIYVDYICGENLKQRIARGGIPVHDLDATPAVSQAERQRRQTEAFAEQLGSFRPAIQDMATEMASRGVYPLDIKLGNLLVGQKTARLYWVDFERAYLSRGVPSAQRLELQYRLLNEWFGLDLVTRPAVAEYARTHEIYSPVDLGPLGHLGDLSEIQAGEGRWRWLLHDRIDWRGKRVLDLGTNNCLYGFREALAGAAEVHCVDRDAAAINEANFIRRAFEQLHRKKLNVRLHHTDIISFLRSQQFPRDHFDVTTALCSIYYLSREEIAESLRIVSRISRECWLQGNVWTPRADPQVAEFSRPEFLARQLRDAGFSDITLVWPRRYRRPLLIGKKPARVPAAPSRPHHSSPGRLNVFLTIDTEFSRSRCRGDAAANIRNDIYGKTDAGDFGITYQADILRRHGLRATFFVEALCACVTGIEPLRRVVDAIQTQGHEVQLHLHPEWLRRMSRPLLGARTGQHLRDYDLEDQTTLIAKGLENLAAAGAADICAFRAGSYAANFQTLRALARNGIRIDSSYNACYLDSTCGLRTESLLTQPAVLEGVCEIPISFFEDWPGHYRHLQLAACSRWELEKMLSQAAVRGWHSVAIVSHSFELIKRVRRNQKPPLPDWVVIRRFERLCEFLAVNKHRFATVGFSEVNSETFPQVASPAPLKSKILRTAGRMGEQLLRRT